MIYERFDIIRVPFPFTDVHSTKKRPALVISNEDYQINYDHCILAMITSAKQSRWIDDIRITDIFATGLLSASIIRMKIFSIDAKLVISKLGALGDSDVDRVLKNLTKYLVS